MTRRIPQVINNHNNITITVPPRPPDGSPNTPPPNTSSANDHLNGIAATRPDAIGQPSAETGGPVSVA